MRGWVRLSLPPLVRLFRLQRNIRCAIPSFTEISGACGRGNFLIACFMSPKRGALSCFRCFTQAAIRWFGNGAGKPGRLGNFTHAARTGDVAQDGGQQRRIVRFQNVSDMRRLPLRCREPALRRTQGRDLIEGIGAMKVDWLHRVNGRGLLDEASLRGAPTMDCGGLCSKASSHQRFQAGRC